MLPVSAESFAVNSPCTIEVGLISAGLQFALHPRFHLSLNYLASGSAKCLLLHVLRCISDEFTQDCLSCEYPVGMHVIKLGPKINLHNNPGRNVQTKPALIRKSTPNSTRISQIYLTEFSAVEVAVIILCNTMFSEKKTSF